MIHVDRRRVHPPSALRDKLAVAARHAAEEFFARPASERRQLSFEFKATVYAGHRVRAALTTLFQGKCAFCESSLLGYGAVEVVHLRPSQSTLDLDGRRSPDHYWWLAYEWENLYAACPACARLRGTRFPVGARRASRATTGRKLDAEQPLLLDPCRDEPEQHLLYLADGTVVSDTERGRATCDIFGLNRADLVEARRETLRSATEEFEALEAPTSEQLAPLLDTSRQFAGLRRQRVAELVGEARAATPEVRVLGPVVKGRVGKEFARLQAERESFSLETEGAPPGYFLHARQIERIEIRDFRVIEALDLSLDLSGTAGPEPRAPWLMLLGENGLGKSTILQGVCLALLDERARDRLDLDASEFVRRGARRATVTVHLTGASESIELIAKRGSRRFSGDGSLKALLLGYGATRLLPTSAHPANEAAGGEPSYARVENLFDPFTPIGDATKWLLSLPHDRFDEVAVGLRKLLLLSDEDRLIRDRRNGCVLAEQGGARVRLENLSAGYQSVIALATDVMKVVLALWDTPLVAEGVAIVDELGAHLHPRWRMRIVEALRSVFPRVQFLASTHDPLCLRGLADNEVVVLRRGAEGAIVALDDLPPASSMRIDQLLASEHFGLGSLVDPEIDALFAEYYALRAKRKPTVAEAARIEALRSELDGKRLLGTTRRERLMYEAADDYLSQEVEVTQHDARAELKSATKARIVAAWKGS